MRRLTLVVVVAILALVVGAAPADAQEDPPRATELSLGGLYATSPSGGQPGIAITALDPFIGPVESVWRVGLQCPAAPNGGGNPFDGCQLNEHAFATAGLSVRVLDREWSVDIGGGLRVGASDLEARTFAPYGEAGLKRWLTPRWGIGVTVAAEPGFENGIRGVATVGLTWAVGR